MVGNKVDALYCTADDLLEPAQEAVRENLLYPEIIELLARDSFDSRPLLGYICPLMNFSVEQCKPKITDFR